MRCILVPAAIAVAASFTHEAFAQESDQQTWAGFFSTVDAGNGRLVWLEAQTRLSEDTSRLGQLLLRSAAGRRLENGQIAYLGYAFVRTSPEGRVATNEHRIWQQYSGNWLVKESYTVSGRTRLEQRWLEGGDEFGWRLRQLIRLNAPLTDTVSAAAWTEPFFNINDTDWGQLQGVDQWRNFVGLNVRLTDSASYEVGYLNQYLVRPADDRVNHTLFIGLTTQF